MFDEIGDNPEFSDFTQVEPTKPKVHEDEILSDKHQSLKGSLEKELNVITLKLLEHNLLELQAAPLDLEAPPHWFLELNQLQRKTF